MTPPPPPTLDTVVVTAPRLPPAAGDAAFDIVRIGQDELAASARLDEALEAVPGVSLFRRTSSLAANPTTQGISTRAIAGSGASRALVTLDGVPQNDPFGGWVVWTALPTEAVEGAAVVRGAGAGPYGAGALSGVVALDGRVPSPGHYALDLTGGDHGYGRAAGVLDSQIGAVSLSTVAAGETSDGWIPVGARRGPADDHLTLHDWTAATTALAPVGRAVLAGRVAVYQEDRDAGLVGAESRARGASASLTLAAQPTADAYGWRLQAWTQLSDLRNSSVSTAPDRSLTTPANIQYQTPAVGWGLNAALRRAATSWSWEVGADVRGAKGESDERFRYMSGAFTRGREAGGSTLVAGVYAEGSHTSGPWLFTGGARLDGWATYDAKRLEHDLATGAPTLTLHPANRSGATPTGRLGARYDLGGGGFLRAAAYAGFRPATLNELHRPFRVGNDVTEANPGLKPERLYGVEAGFGQEAGPIGWDATVFYNVLEDAIANVTIGFGPGTFPVAGFVPAGGVLRQRQNAGSVEAAGVELGASGEFSDRLRLRVAADYTQAKVDGGSVAPQLTGLRPAQTPRVAVTGSIAWRPLDRLTLRTDVRYEGARFDDDLNTRRLAAGATVDARAEWRVATGTTVFVAAENLSGADIETARTADGVVSYDAPRMIRVGLTLSR